MMRSIGKVRHNMCYSVLYSRSWCIFNLFQSSLHLLLDLENNVNTTISNLLITFCKTK